jgi:hypothetical protein
MIEKLKVAAKEEAILKWLVEQEERFEQDLEGVIDHEERAESLVLREGLESARVADPDGEADSDTGLQRGDTEDLFDTIALALPIVPVTPEFPGGVMPKTPPDDKSWLPGTPPMPVADADADEVPSRRSSRVEALRADAVRRLQAVVRSSPDLYMSYSETYMGIPVRIHVACQNS